MVSQQEQAIARDWLYEFGHDHQYSLLARLGASDWLMEEILQMAEEGNTVSLDGVAPRHERLSNTGGS